MTQQRNVARSCFFALLITAADAAAQSAGGYSVDPSKEPPPTVSTVLGDRPSPAATQDRLFAGTRFWRLDPGRYEVEVWWNDDFFADAPSQALLQAEIEIGLAPHLQLDLYQNLNVDGTGANVEGEQIELRYAFARRYNEIPLNPVLYLEYHPRRLAQDRAEVRLLLGTDFAGIGMWAVNAYAELNIDGYGSASSQGTDMETGLSAATSFALVHDVLRLGAEIQAGVDQHATPQWHPVTLIGPNVLLKIPGADLKLTATTFFGLMQYDPRVRLLIIAGYGF